MKRNDILRETIRVCEEHDIRYFLIGGTAIGALYDQAILPWDDDIDIGMTRDQYNRFLEVAPTALGGQYFLSYYETDPKTPYYFAKVRKNGTLFKEETFSEIAMHQGIFIDVFPFDKIPDNGASWSCELLKMLFVRNRDMDVEIFRYS